MRQAEYTASPPDRSTTNNAVADHPHASFLNWIAHFTVYVGVVALVCALGVYFFWHVPLPQDLAQLFKNDTPSKPLNAGTPPPKMQMLTSAAVQPSADAAAPEAALTTAPQQPASATPNPPNADDDVVVAAEAPSVAADTPPPAPTTPEAPAPLPTPQTEIEQLLTEAQQQMESRRITAPANNNALSSYQRVLELDPNNAAAKAGMERIAAHYREVAENSLRQGRPDESLAYIQRGLRAAPQSQELTNLRSQAQLLQQQREAEQRQAQREEQRRREAEQALTEQQYQEELREQQALQMRRQQAPPPAAARPWWQEPPTYNQSSGFQSK